MNPYIIDTIRTSMRIWIAPYMNQPIVSLSRSLFELSSGKYIKEIASYNSIGGKNFHMKEQCDSHCKQFIFESNLNTRQGRAHTVSGGGESVNKFSSSQVFSSSFWTMSMLKVYLVVDYNHLSEGYLSHRVCYSLS